MNKNISVLHVLGELKPSGAETMFRVAAPLFFAEGVHAEIVATGPNLGPFAPELANAGYKLHHIPFAKSPRFLTRLYTLMRAGKYDVLHLHTERASFWIGLVALAARPSLVLRTIHNNFTFRGPLRLVRMAQRRILQSLGLVYVSIGASVEKTELIHFGLKTHVVSNWYDSNRFVAPSTTERNLARESLGIVGNEIVLVSIGNCSKVKNHSALIEAIALLPVGIRPLYLHAGIEEAGQPERKLAVRLGIADRIRFLGPLEDVLPVLYAADLFVMTSLVEGFSIAALEALGCGLPAIFTEVDGLRDLKLIYPNLIYCGITSEEIAKCINNVLAMNKNTLRNQSKNYTMISRNYFGMEQGVSKYYWLYKNNINKFNK